MLPAFIFLCSPLLPPWIMDKAFPSSSALDDPWGSFSKGRSLPKHVEIFLESSGCLAGVRLTTENSDMDPCFPQKLRDELHRAWLRTGSENILSWEGSIGINHS